MILNYLNKQQLKVNLNKLILIVLAHSSISGWRIELSKAECANIYKKNFDNLILKSLTLKCGSYLCTKLEVSALKLLPLWNLVAGLSNGMIQIWDTRTNQLKHIVV